MNLSPEAIALLLEVLDFFEVNDLERPRDSIPSAPRRAQLHIREQSIHQLRPAS